MDPLKKPRKNVYIAYLFWMLGGFFGLHHFYLHRDTHAFVIWSTFAGGFGFGWLIDFFKIPYYVEEFNQDCNYVNNLIIKMKKNEIPPISLHRKLGSILTANIFAFLTMQAIPIEFFTDKYNSLNFVYMLFLPLSIAIGIYLVGNIGTQKGSFIVALKGAYYFNFFYLILSKAIFFNSLFCYIYFEKKGVSWKKKPEPYHNLFKRLVNLFVYSLIYILLCSSWIWFNCTQTNNDGETIKCRESIINYFNSPSWQEIVHALNEIKNYIKIYGIRGFIMELFFYNNNESEEDAFSFFDLPKNATSKEISQKYRQLSRIYHPDKQKSPQEKVKAEEMFIMLQKSYRILLRAGRVSRKI